MKWKVLALVLLLLPAFSFAADTTAQTWQTGKLIKISKSTQKSEVPRTKRSPGREIDDIEWTMVIEADHTLYYGEIDADTPPPLTENKDIQWMLVKDKIHYKDDNGKEHKAKLIKKRAEDTPPPAPADK